jgi:hypothetical protein
MESGMSWVEYLKHDRANKLSQAVSLAAGKVRLHVTTKGVQKDITQQQLEKLEAEIAEIEQILIDEGVPFDA